MYIVHLRRIVRFNAMRSTCRHIFIQDRANRLLDDLLDPWDTVNADIELWVFGAGAADAPLDWEEQLRLRQTDDVIAAIQDTEWRVRLRLGRFQDGCCAIFLTLPSDMPGVTPDHLLQGTKWEGVPYHITLGYGHWRAKRFMLYLCRMESVATMRLRKISPSRAKTGYEIVGGSLYQLLWAAQGLGFSPGGRAQDRNAPWCVAL